MNWESGLDKEIRFHLEQAVREYMASGLTEEEARAQARRDFGTIDLTKEECRDTLALRWLRDLGQDLRYAFRSHRKMPAVAAVAIVTLALGIGSATTVFSLVHAVLLRSLPYRDVKSLVYVYSPNTNMPSLPDEMGPSNATYFAWQRLSRSFEDLARFDQLQMRLNVGGNSQERINVLRVTGNLFRTLGSDAEIGRTIGPEDDQPGHEGVAVISHSLWQHMYGGAGDILRQTIRLNGRPYRIVGVMDRDFRYPASWEVNSDVFPGTPIYNDVWIPLALSPAERADEGFSGFGEGTVIGRLRPGVTAAQAQAEMKTIMQHLVEHREGVARGSTAAVKTLLATAFGDVKEDMLLLLGSVVFVLLLTCGNVANLLLARYSDRAHEMAVRAALGASRSRLVRLIVGEGLLLTGLGGALGTVLAVGGVRVLVKFAPGEMPRAAETSIDLQVLLFAVGASLATGLLCGLLSALSASRAGVATQLQTGGTRGAIRTSRTRHTLIACETALALILVTGSGLLIRSYIRLAAEGPGFAEDVLSTRIFLPDEYSPDRETNLYRKILSDLNARPEVVAAGANTNLPFGRSASVRTLEIEGRSTKEGLSVHHRGVSTRYFDTMRIPVLAGRVFEEHDYSSTVGRVVASEAFAKQYYPGQNAVGKRIRSGPDAPWEEIIGVVRNVKNFALEEAPLGEIYQSLDRKAQPEMFFVLRGRIPAIRLVPIFREVVLAKEPATAFGEFETMKDRTWEAGAARRFQTSLMSGFASLALVLAVVGLFGLVGHSVRMRTREIGVRAALGATRGRIFTMILLQGLRLLAGGALAGVAGSWALTRFLAEWLYGVGTTDPVTFLAAPLLLVAAGLTACAIPGRRAARIDPAVALRYE